MEFDRLTSTAAARNRGDDACGMAEEHRASAFASAFPSAFASALQSGRAQTFAAAFA